MAAHDYRSDFLGIADVGERIGVEQDQVGGFAGFDGADLLERPK